MIELFRSTKNRQWYFRVVARNGKTIAQSEGYKSKRGRNRGYNTLINIGVGGWQITEIDDRDHRK